eukprot:CAMPEP_0116128684 /NCGR_PEP_ID=MMETSP0329-20121206/7490_1 /TAXON_ID=697910 /ORGANISM="Pseudo-nitzschia arenysensis, Strain B593" /LENGTH=293 /DNA_ID=CAMNT_0003622837 /DNA_START=168 /DNA_END=1049 /DNA_ORIENTATION=-
MIATRFCLQLSSLSMLVSSVLCFSIPDVHHLHSAVMDSMNHVVLPHSSSSINIASAFPGNNPDTAAFFDPLSEYKQLLKTHPLPTKMITGATLAVCGDAIAQSKDADVAYDKRRASSFAVFDMAYRALQHFSFPIIVAYCHGQILGSLPVVDALDSSQLAAMEQTLASQLGIVPFMYYPAFFTISGAIQGLSASASWTRAQETFIPLMKRNLLFWIPVQFIQFGYIQEDLQIPFLSCAGLVWTFILSVYAGSATKSHSPEKDMELQEQTVEASSLEGIKDGLRGKGGIVAGAR